ncbi:hypothetical protein [Spirosoma panaciterrae]|uniref:hypothetical protein n=1 Tax=Spirosoma panaciterrae TaxID=496058 RepID=UPI00036CFA33|nr:hypothetical protein [Spirosoma panaciterrae]
MKKIFFLTILLVESSVCFGQIRFHHLINKNTITSYGFDLVSGGSSVDLCVTRKGIVSVSGGKINVDIWRILDQTTCPNGIDRSTAIGSGLQIVDRRNTYGQPTRVLVLPFSAINLGVNTLPFRIRQKVTVDETGATIPATGTSAFQLAFNVGYTYGFSQITTRAITNWSATIGGYFGPSTADLKKETVKHPSLWTTNQTNATLTYGFNLILARNNFGLVFAYGFEKALGMNKEEWVYNGKPYFGFGINTNFLR